jgi:DNA-binding transcriptional regulator YiaG
MKTRRHILEAVRRKERLERGEVTPGRVTEVTLSRHGRHSLRRLDPKVWQRRQAAVYAVSVAGVREKLGLTQQRFADLLGISRRTLENWEQGHREPTGAAKVLLRIAAKSPRTVLAAVA